MNKISHISDKKLSHRLQVCNFSDNFSEIRVGAELVLVNSDNGQILETWRYDGRKLPEERDWMRLYQRMAYEIIRSGAIRSFTEHQVLWYMLAHTGFGNMVVFSQKQVAAELGVSRQAVSKALGNLVKHKVIEKDIVQGRMGSYRLDPNFGWKGKREWRGRHQERWAQRMLESFEDRKLKKEGTGD